MLLLVNIYIQFPATALKYLVLKYSSEPRLE